MTTNVQKSYINAIRPVFAELWKKENKKQKISKYENLGWFGLFVYKIV